MIKTVKHLLFLAAGLCVLVGPPREAWAQSGPLASLSESFDRYRLQTLQEKIYVHTDQTSYLAGETMWFKLYYLDGTDHQALNLSKVAYLEVLDAQQVPVLQTKLALEKGAAQGSLTIPANLASGHYQVRAYTNWMKNFGPEYFFHLPVTVLNPFVPLGLKPLSSSLEPDVHFFPEGGRLVQNLESKVAFRAIGPDGRGLAVRGYLLNQRNDTLARFAPLRAGIGHFSFTPTPENQYRVLLRLPNGQQLTRQLPPIQDQGVVMRLQQEGPDRLTVTISAYAPDQSQQPDRVYLLAHTRQVPKVAQEGVLQGGQVSFSVAKSDLGEGVTHFTVFSPTRQPLCERLYFTPVTTDHRLQINLTADQASYDPRSPVALNLRTASGTGTPETAGLSVAVFRVDSLSAPSQASLLSYLWLTSDLKGHVEQADYYLTQTGPEVNQAIDNLMLTHGWRRFAWADVLQPTVPAFQHVPEYGGHLIQGRVLHRGTGAPAPQLLTYLASPSQQVRLHGSRSDKGGRIRFEVRDLYGTRDLILQTNTQRDSTYRFEITTPFASEVADQRLPSFDLAPALARTIQDHSVHLQVQRVHQPDSTHRYRRPDLNLVPFYGEPDRRFNLDDYTRFPVLEEVMREYVPPVMVRKRRGKFHFMVHDTRNKGVFQEDPLVLYDGVPVFDTDKIMAVDPRKIKTLDVVSRKYLLGPLTFKGIVSYTSYKGDMDGYQPDPRALLVDYEGLQLEREFYAPVYDSPEATASRLPDLRQLLHWAPNVTTDAQGNAQLPFYTSDLDGVYLVVVHGLSKGGRVGTQRLTFEVKRPL